MSPVRGTNQRKTVHDDEEIAESTKIQNGDNCRTLTIPAAICRRYDLTPGDKINWISDNPDEPPTAVPIHTDPDDPD